MNSELKVILDAVNGLKSEINDLRNELNDFKGEFNRFKTEVNQRFDRQDDMIEQLINNVAATNPKFNQFQEEQQEMKQELKQLKVAHLDSFRDINSQLETIKSQQTDIEFAHTKITQNERDIAKIKKVILG